MQLPRGMARSTPTAPQMGMEEFQPHGPLHPLLCPKTCSHSTAQLPCHPIARSWWGEAVETQAQHLRFMLGAGEALGMAAVVRECVGENSRAELGDRALGGAPCLLHQPQNSCGSHRAGAEGDTEPWRCSLLALSSTGIHVDPTGMGLKGTKSLGGAPCLLHRLQGFVWILQEWC